MGKIFNKSNNNSSYNMYQNKSNRKKYNTSSTVIYVLKLWLLDKKNGNEIFNIFKQDYPHIIISKEKILEILYKAIGYLLHIIWKMFMHLKIFLFCSRWKWFHKNKWKNIMGYRCIKYFYIHTNWIWGIFWKKWRYTS